MNRTNKQNASLHLYLSQLADELNAAGYDFKQVVKLPVSFTPDNVKENMMRPLMIAMYPDIESTTELDTIQIQKLYDTLNAATADRLGVSLPFPNRFEQ